ncbi:MAG: rod shape-determining protein MreD [Actinomycetota bacterium]
MQHLLLSSLILIGTFLAQTVIVPHLTVAGIQPDLMLVVIVCFALTEGMMKGATSGFAGGLLEDLVMANYMGFNMVTKTIIGAAASLFKDLGPREGILWPLVAVFSASLVSQVMTALLAFLFGETVVVRSILNWSMIPTAIYNSLFTPFIYPAYIWFLKWQERVAWYQGAK